MEGRATPTTRLSSAVMNSAIDTIASVQTGCFVGLLAVIGSRSSFGV